MSYGLVHSWLTIEGCGRDRMNLAVIIIFTGSRHYSRLNLEACSYTVVNIIMAGSHWFGLTPLKTLPNLMEMYRTESDSQRQFRIRFQGETE